MKNGRIKITSLACAFALVAGITAGCGNTSKKEPAASTNTANTVQQPAEPVKLSLFMPDGGRIFKEDNAIVKELEKKLNIKLDYTLVPPGEVLNKYGVLVASGSTPDITRLNALEYFQFVNQGVYLDIGSLIDTNAPNLKKMIKPESLELVKYQGKLYAIPYENNAGKYVHVARQDWLDNLGLKIPATLDEFTDMLRKFTLNDPDKNGKNDTFGFAGTDAGGSIYQDEFMPIFGAFGLQPQQFYLKADKVYATSISPEYKATLEYIAMLFSEKLIDPDIFITKKDQALQNLVQSKSGSFNAWWSIAPQVLVDQLKMNQVNPSAKWAIIPPIKGKDGQYGMRSNGVIGGTNSISAKCKNPETALKLLDYLSTDDGWLLTSQGIQGVHYTEKYKPTDSGKQAKNEKWLDVFSQLVGRPDKLKEMYNATNPTYSPYIVTADESKLYENLFYGLTTTDFQTLNPDIKKLEEEWFIKFATGAEPISKFDEYVNQWKNKGGKQMSESLLKEYNSRKGTNYTMGN